MNPFVAHLIYGLATINAVLAVLAFALLVLEYLGGRHPLPPIEKRLDQAADTREMPVFVLDLGRSRAVLDERTPGGDR